jgi:hypothetical protein
LNGGQSEQKVTTLDKDLARNISAKYGSNPSTKFNCSYIARSSLTYILGFSVKFFFQPIYTDYAN